MDVGGPLHDARARACKLREGFTDLFLRLPGCWDVCERLELGVRASVQPVPEHAVAEEDFSGLFESVRPSVHPRCFFLHCMVF